MRDLDRGLPPDFAPHILVVEDEAFILRTISALLERRGHRVTGARDGREALEVVQRRWPDLVLLDLMLPEVNGFQFLRRLREIDPGHTPVVIVSSRVDAVDHFWARKLGADDFVRKPFTAERLSGAVDAALAATRARVERLRSH